MFNTVEISNYRLFNEFLKDPERKDLLNISGEVLLLLLRFGSFPRHYFSRYLFKKGRNNITDYFPDKFLYRIKPYFNDKEVREVLENKLYFNFFYSQFGINLPKILMFNHKSIFVIDSKIYKVNNLEDFKLLLLKLLKNNPADDSVFVKKTYWSYGGDQIYKVTLKQIETDVDLISTLFSKVIKSGFIFQNTVKQHAEMQKLNPSCLNTLRFDTFIDMDGNVEIMSGFLRTSIKNLFVDNISSGGCMIHVDLNSGRLSAEGFSVLKVHGVKLMTEHPVTKTIFKDFTIPFFNQAKELVIKSASLVPSLRLVGWDVGIGEESPVLIEGNSDYGIPGNDLTYGGYRSNPVFRKVLEEFKYLR
jgi:hypothetical protein